MNYNPMVKSPATIQAQIDKLVERGCIIEDMKEAKRTLTNINYYRLAYYFALFLEDKHHYRQGTSFEKIMRIYDFDRMLRSLLLSVLEEIEITMRAVISNFHAMKYGALGYLNPSSFDFHHKHQPFLTKIDRMIESNTDEDLVAHHLTKYGGAFPLWVIMELFSFGTLNCFYSDMHPQDKKEIAETNFGISSKYLENWLQCLSDLRNHCAHYNRLYGNGFSDSPRTPADYDGALGNTLFDYVVIMKRLYKRPESWESNFLSELRELFNRYEKDIDLLQIGFSEDWETALKAAPQTASGKAAP